jgi:hypothetical protein
MNSQVTHTRTEVQAYGAIFTGGSAESATTSHGSRPQAVGHRRMPEGTCIEGTYIEVVPRKGSGR